MITLNCSTGEGGGQIMRSALSISCILQKPVKLVNIRAKRPKSGLQAQHLKCVEALTQITSAETRGAHLGSTELIFNPKKINSGKYEFDIGTAGSCTLLAQCILPVLLFASSKSEVVINGGTHVPFSPPFPHLHQALIPALNLMGAQVKVHLFKPGFYPVGGGKIKLEVEPLLNKMCGLHLLERKSLRNLQGNVIYSNLPKSVLEREVEILKKLTPEIKVEKLSANSPGNCVWITSTHANVSNVFSALGETGKSAEKVASSAIAEFTSFEKSKAAAVEKHLADQLLLYCAFASEKSEFTTSEKTLHLETNALTITQLKPNVKINTESKNNAVLVKVEV